MRLLIEYFIPDIDIIDSNIFINYLLYFGLIIIPN
jgi:hypothetical protein